MRDFGYFNLNNTAANGKCLELIRLPVCTRLSIRADERKRRASSEKAKKKKKKKKKKTGGWGEKPGEPVSVFSTTSIRPLPRQLPENPFIVSK